MTTAPNPTAEQVIGAAMQLAAISLGQTVSGTPKAGDLARYILRHGNAASSLSEGAPTEEQIEAATWALIDWDTDIVDRAVRDEHYRERRAEVERIAPILTAGVVPQEKHLSNAEILERIAEQEREAAGAPAPQEPSIIEGRCRACGNEAFEGTAEGVIDYLDAPSTDREKLIAEYVNPRMPGRQNSDGHLMAQAFRAGWDAALAAPLDTEKVAEIREGKLS